MTQLSLFDPQEPLPPGTIVRQTWPWIGLYDVIYPYWQVRYAAHPGTPPRRHETGWVSYNTARDFTLELPGAPLQYYCVAVPHGVYFASRCWFSPRDLVDTGLRWRVPTWQEIHDWPARDDRRSAPTDWQPDDVRLPYTAEAELVALLNTLPVSWHWGAVTRTNFYTLWPVPTIKNWRGRSERDEHFRPAEVESKQPLQTDGVQNSAAGRGAG